MISVSVNLRSFGLWHGAKLTVYETILLLRPWIDINYPRDTGFSVKLDMICTTLWHNNNASCGICHERNWA
jgi:hypothetical protein